MNETAQHTLASVSQQVADTVSLRYNNNNNNNNNNANIFMQDFCFSFRKKKTAINAGPVKN